MKNLVLASAVALGLASFSSLTVAAPTPMSDSQLDHVAAGLTWNINQGNIAFNDLVDANGSSSSNTMTVSGNRNRPSQTSSATTDQSNGSLVNQGNYVGLGFFFPT